MKTARLTVTSLLALIFALSWAAEGLLPTFSGFLISLRASMAVRWQTAAGRSVQAWLRVGDRAGDFKVVGFEPKTEILSLEDRLGHHYHLSLPEGRVRQEKLTDSEYSELFAYLMPGADVARAPVLSREKARAFYLEKIRRMFATVENVEITFDMDGSTLPPGVQARWEEDNVRARAAGTLRRALIINGKTQVHEFPLHPFPMPEQMTRSLFESDWDEISLLVFTSSLKRRLIDK